MIYLDHAASTPLAEALKKTYHRLLDEDVFGNPTARHHQAGNQAFEQLEFARQKVASLVGAQPEQIFFTASATEANNIVLQGFYRRFHERGCVFLVNPLEHKSVLQTCEYLGQQAGCETKLLSLLANGTIDMDALEAILQQEKRAVLVTVMSANNEVPIRNPVEKIATLCQNYGAAFHCDDVQGFVRKPLDFNLWGATSVVLSCHKIYGPKGIAILIANVDEPRFRLAPLMWGGGQERDLRPGTVNVLGAVLAAETIALHLNRQEELLAHLRACDKAFISILSKQKTFHLTVPASDQVPGILSFWIEGMNASVLLESLPEICLNRGASCLGAGGEVISHVPHQLGLEADAAQHVVRASFGFGVTVEELRHAASLLQGFC